MVARQIQSADNGEEVSILTTTGRGYFIVGILGARQEPTNHAMRDIAQFANDFEDWGRSMVLLFKDEQGWKNFDTKEFGTLPQTITYGIDMNQTITNMWVKGANLPNANSCRFLLSRFFRSDVSFLKGLRSIWEADENIIHNCKRSMRYISYVLSTDFCLVHCH
jgi:hypothetical protein